MPQAAVLSRSGGIRTCSDAQPFWSSCAKDADNCKPSSLALSSLEGLAAGILLQCFAAMPGYSLKSQQTLGLSGGERQM